MSVPLASGSHFTVRPGDLAPLLSLPPGVRGFWTDEELLAGSGISSVPTLKKLQGTGWLMPSHIPMAEGGRRRAWAFREMLRAVLVGRLAPSSGVAVIGIATLLRSLPSRWMDNAIEHWVSAAATDTVLSRVSPPSLVWIVNMSEAWIEGAAGKFELGAQALGLAGANLSATSVARSSRVATAPELISLSVTSLVLNSATVLQPFVQSVADIRAGRGGGVQG